MNGACYADRKWRSMGKLRTSYNEGAGARTNNPQISNSEIWLINLCLKKKSAKQRQYWVMLFHLHFPCYANSLANSCPDTHLFGLYLFACDLPMAHCVCPLFEYDFWMFLITSSLARVWFVKQQLINRPTSHHQESSSEITTRPLAWLWRSCANSVTQN